MAKQKTSSQGFSKKPNNRKGNQRNRSNKNRAKGAELEVGMEGVTKGGSDRPHNTAAQCADNDPNWYTHIYPLVQDVANFNYNIPVGTPFNPGTGLTSHVIGTTTVSMDPSINLGKVVPGIFTFRVAPSIGISADPTSAPNVAAQQLYSLVRKANSGSVNYDKTDLMMMIVAMDSAYMLYEEMLRAYRLIGRYDVNSRYMPDALMYSLGFAPDLQKNLADFRGLLDTFAYKFSAINVPDQFDFIKRHSWLFTNVYTDSEASKAQLYAYVPDGFYVWQEASGDQPAYLRYISRESLYLGDIVDTLDKMYQAMNEIMEPLLGSQDIGTMSGDIAKAFGESGMISVMPAAQYETLTPVYSMEVIQQMMNSTIVGTRLSNPDIHVKYDNLTSGPYLTFEPTVDTALPYCLHGLHKHLINLKQPGGVDINMVATRNICNIDFTGNTSNAPITSCGTEVVVRAYINVLVTSNGYLSGTKPLKVEFKQNVLLPIRNAESAASMSTTDLSDLQDAVQSMVFATAFDNHPSMYIFYQNKWKPNENNLVSFQGVFQDYENYAWLDDQTVKQMNDAALLSLFYTQAWPTL